MPDLRVFATIRPRPEDREAVLSALRAILGPTRAEAGCLRFELNHGTEGDGALYLVESWTDAQALEAHHAMPHTVAAAALIEGKLAAATEVITMVAVG